MGVTGLWTVVQPCARPTNLATLNRKRLAVDASIWIYQFLKAVRDKEGNALRSSHVVGFFRRICKLLWFGIRPVFVFDGGAPVLKRATLQGRRHRREGRREDAARTAGKLLAVQMQRLAEAEAERRRERRRAEEADQAQDQGRPGQPQPAPRQEEQEELPDTENMVYADELGMSKQERQKSRKFHKQDAYHLPELPIGGFAAMGGGGADDPRIMSLEELEEYARQFNAGENINLYDFSKIDFDGDFFRSLPPADRYNILNAARIRSRLRMGLSKEQLDEMFPDRMAFSRFQIERVRERNHLTQRLMYELGMTGTDWTVGDGARIAGDKDREYILVKNEGAEGGWALGVVSRAGRDEGKADNPIDVDALDFEFQDKDKDWEEEDDDADFEDVPIEGLNRLPRLQGQPGSTAYERARELGSARQRLYNSLQSGDDEDADDALFVNDGEPRDAELFGDNNDETMLDEEEELNRAIAMSLESQHNTERSKPQDAADTEVDDEDLAAPKWIQKAVDPARPITGSSSGKMIAHIVNNRANAAVPKPRDAYSNEGDEGDSDDDEMDLQAALRAARKEKQKAEHSSAPPPRSAAAAAVRKPATANPFGGPLPFEKLDWKFPALSRKPISGPVAVKKPELVKAVETGAYEAESDEEAGGFEKEAAAVDGDDGEGEGEGEGEEGGEKKVVASIREREDAPRPLPPWLADDHDHDIRESVREQNELDDVMNAEDEKAREEEIQRRNRDIEIIEISSSDGNESDVVILDAPPTSPYCTPPPPRRTPTPKLGASLPSMDDHIAPKPAERASVTQEEAPTQPEADGAPMSTRHPTQSPPPEESPSREESTDEDVEDVALPMDRHEPESIDLTNDEDTQSVQADEDENEDEDDDGLLVVDDPSPEESAEEDFEDVALPMAMHEPESIDLTNDEDAQSARTQSTQADDDDDDDDGLLVVDDPDAPAPEEFDDAFSDAEDGELLAQLAQEAEEHARFASELNPTTSRGGARAAYEDEVKQLRTQQRKDRRDADEVTQVMVAECQALLRLFGVPYITAPMEAEAQCAELVTLGLVDGIVTDDSDIFLFGGTRVFKNMFNGNKLVECYLGADLERELSLGRAELIALAQLLGSDYAEGLPGVGPVTAVEILSEFPGGQQGLAEFATWWRAAQQSQANPATAAAELRAEPTAFRRKLRKSQAARLFLPPGFPSPAVEDAYLKPEVDRSPEAFQWGVPDVEGLRRFLTETIGWSQERTDEVLVPVIRDMNRREAEGTQSNITRFFEGSVGVGSRAPQQKGGAAGTHAKGRGNAGAGGSKRMAEAVSRLKAKAGRGAEDPRAESVVSAPPEAEEDGIGEKGGQENAKGKGAGVSVRKRKRTARASVEDEEDEEGTDEVIEIEDEDDDEDEDEARHDGSDADGSDADGSDTEDRDGKQARNSGMATRTRRTEKKRART